jgi:serine/threonine-protein kinase RsbW
MTQPTDPPVHLALAADARLLRVARLVGAGLASDLDLDVEQLADIRLAIGEAGALCIQMGAAELSFGFWLDDGVLAVQLEAHVDPDSESETEEATLAHQILAVACSSVETTHDSARLTFRMTFDAHR